MPGEPANGSKGDLVAAAMIAATLLSARVAEVAGAGAVVETERVQRLRGAKSAGSPVTQQRIAGTGLRRMKENPRKMRRLLALQKPHTGLIQTGMLIVALQITSPVNLKR